MNMQDLERPKSSTGPRIMFGIAIAKDNSNRYTRRLVSLKSFLQRIRIRLNQENNIAVFFRGRCGSHAKPFGRYEVHR